MTVLCRSEISPARTSGKSKLVNVHFLAFVHLGTPHVGVSPSPNNPNGDRSTQQARNFQMHVEDENLKSEIFSRDNDGKCTESFDTVFI